MPGRGKRRVYCDGCSKRGQQRRYKEHNRETVLQAARNWRHANPEKQRAAGQAWRGAHTEYLSEQARNAWADPERRAKNQERLRNWSERNRAKLSAKAVAYAKAHPEKVRQIQATRRARKAGAAICDFTEADWQELLVEFDNRCAYCGTADVPLEREHMVPLARGGDHTKANIVPSCGPCNRRKWTMTAEEFFEYLGHINR